MARRKFLKIQDQQELFGVPTDEDSLIRHFALDAALTHATGTAERAATLSMLDRRARKHRITLGADKPMT